MLANAPTANQPYVFISYASADRARVLEIVAALREAGISCWLDQHDIAGGTNWGGSIVEAIQGCSVLVLLSSAASLSSRNVHQEIALAWQHEKPCIPLLLDLTPVPNDLAYWLATAQWIEVLDHPQQVWVPKVVAAVAQVTGSPEHDSVAPTAGNVGRLPSMSVVPSPPSSFIGRERDVADVASLLASERIVTVTGPGGIGKTRLAIAAGHRLASTYAAGVAFIDLAPIRDPALVLPTVAAGLGVRESGGVPLRDALVAVLRPLQRLLILDNLEQVVEGAREIGHVVAACPSLRILATSREPLRLTGETEYPLAPLLLPDTRRDMDIERVRTTPAVELFVQRARAVKPGFELTSQNADAIVAICRRLDGLPLAIELAASRSRLFSPASLLERLNQPLQFLTGGARDLPDRQRTIRDTIAWSYELLSPEEQRLFSRLSVFVGGWTLESAAAVVAADGDLSTDLLDGLASLVDKSLVVQRELPDGEVRFTMLGTIREFGEQQLVRAGEQALLCSRHAAVLVAMAEAADVAIRGPQQPQVLRQLLVEQDNLRAAMARSLHDGTIESRVGQRIAVAMVWFWFTHNRFHEGHAWLSLALAVAPHPDDPLRAKAQIGDGMMRWRLGELEAALELVADGTRAVQVLGEAWYAAFGVHQLAHLRDETGDLDEAVRLFEHSINAFDAVGDPWGVALGHSCLGRTLFARGDLDDARTLLTRAVVEMEHLGDEWYLSTTWQRLADVTLAQGRWDESAGWYRAGLSRFAAQGDDLSVADAFVRLAQIAVEMEQPDRAAQLFGAAEVIHDTHHIVLYSRLRMTYDQTVARLWAALGDEAMQRQWAVGRQLSLDEAIAVAMGNQFSDDGSNPVSASLGLSGRTLTA